MMVESRRIEEFLEIRKAYSRHSMGWRFPPVVVLRT